MLVNPVKNILHCIFHVNNGPYSGAIIKSRIILSNLGFENLCPVVMIDTPVMHPLLSKDGKLNTFTRFPVYTDSNYLFQIINYVKFIFRVTFLESMNGTLMTYFFDSAVHSF